MFSRARTSQAEHAADLFPCAGRPRKLQSIMHCQSPTHAHLISSSSSVNTHCTTSPCGWRVQAEGYGSAVCTLQGAVTFGSNCTADHAQCARC